MLSTSTQEEIEKIGEITRSGQSKKRKRAKSIISDLEKKFDCAGEENIKNLSYFAKELLFQYIRRGYYLDEQDHSNFKENYILRIFDKRILNHTLDPIKINTDSKLSSESKTIKVLGRMMPLFDKTVKNKEINLNYFVSRDTIFLYNYLFIKDSDYVNRFKRELGIDISDFELLLNKVLVGQYDTLEPKNPLLRN